MGPGRFLAQLFHRFLVYNFSPAGWFFFAGGSHFVGIFGPNFWYHFWSQFLAPGCPQIQGLLFNLKFLVPVLGTRFGPQTWDQKPYSFLFQTPVTFQPNFEQSVHLTTHGNQIGPRFGYLGPSQTMRNISLSTLFGVSFGAQS